MNLVHEMLRHHPLTTVAFAFMVGRILAAAGKALLPRPAPTRGGMPTNHLPIFDRSIKQ